MGFNHLMGKLMCTIKKLMNIQTPATKLNYIPMLVI